MSQLLKLDDGAQCTEAKAIAEHKLGEIQHRLADLQRIQVALTELVERCSARRGKVTCALIGSLRRM